MTRAAAVTRRRRRLRRSRRRRLRRSRRRSRRRRRRFVGGVVGGVVGGAVGSKRERVGERAREQRERRVDDKLGERALAPPVRTSSATSASAIIRTSVGAPSGLPSLRRLKACEREGRIQRARRDDTGRCGGCAVVQWARRSRAARGMPLCGSTHAGIQRHFVSPCLKTGVELARAHKISPLTHSRTSFDWS